MLKILALYTVRHPNIHTLLISNFILRANDNSAKLLQNSNTTLTQTKLSENTLNASIQKILAYHAPGVKSNISQISLSTYSLALISSFSIPIGCLSTSHITQKLFMHHYLNFFFSRCLIPISYTSHFSTPSSFFIIHSKLASAHFSTELQKPSSYT